MFSKEVGDAVRTYLLTMDDKFLQTACDILKAESKKSTISASAICLPNTSLMDVLALLETQQVLSFSRAQYTPSRVDVPVYEIFRTDDLVRVFPVGFPEDGAGIDTIDFIVCRVVWVDGTNGQMVLAPEAIL